MRHVSWHWKLVIIIVLAIIVAMWIFFNLMNMGTWMSLNDPFGGRWLSVQLTDGEIVYGHPAGVTAYTIGLTDVYLLNNVNAEASPFSTSTDFSLGSTGQPQVGQAIVPVSYTDQLYLQRSAVLYFKFVAPGDPALQYLR